MHGSMRHICATTSGSFFPRWAFSDRIGASYALLALCREARTWLQLQDARVELSILQMLLDPCHEVHPVTFGVLAPSFAVCVCCPITSRCPGANEWHPYGYCSRAAWSEPDAAHDQTCSRLRLPSFL